MFYPWCSGPQAGVPLLWALLEVEGIIRHCLGLMLELALRSGGFCQVEMRKRLLQVELHKYRHQVGKPTVHL